jgi:hypothetical protein
MCVRYKDSLNLVSSCILPQFVSRIRTSAIKQRVTYMVGIDPHDHLAFAHCAGSNAGDGFVEGDDFHHVSGAPGGYQGKFTLF